MLFSVTGAIFLPYTIEKTENYVETEERRKNMVLRFCSIDMAGRPVGIALNTETGMYSQESWSYMGTQALVTVSCNGIKKIKDECERSSYRETKDWDLFYGNTDIRKEDK